MSQPLKILHVHSGNLYGGVETFLTALARHGHYSPDMDQRFALCFRGRLSEELTALGSVTSLVHPVRISRPWIVWRARRSIRGIFNEFRPSVVICHAPWAQAIFGPAVRAVGLPLVYWQHGTVYGKNLLERYASLTVPDLALTNSHYTADTVRNLYPHTRCDVVRYPVSPPPSAVTDSRSRVRQALDTDPDATVIVQVSRMEPWKGQRLHLEALGLLANQPDWICWQVGGAQRPEELRYLEEMKTLADSAGVADRVRFLGERSDVQDLLAAADIFCQPNLGPEPFGIVFVEALYAGLPVVTTAMGGPLEIVSDSCGRLTEPEDPEELAAALLDLIQHRDTRRELGEAAPQRAFELCDPAGQMREMENVLRSLAAELKD